ncbi:MAG: hypothetical protein KC561_18555, partial [Myxococcales bacterium]|nr:hypothetical protein [Myxococcales bacterium]
VQLLGSVVWKIYGVLAEGWSSQSDQQAMLQILIDRPELIQEHGLYSEVLLKQFSRDGKKAAMILLNEKGLLPDYQVFAYDIEHADIIAEFGLIPVVSQPMCEAMVVMLANSGWRPFSNTEATFLAYMNSDKGTAIWQGIGPEVRAQVIKAMGSQLPDLILLLRTKNIIADLVTMTEVNYAPGESDAIGIALKAVTTGTALTEAELEQSFQILTQSSEYSHISAAVTAMGATPDLAKKILTKVPNMWQTLHDRVQRDQAALSKVLAFGVMLGYLKSPYQRQKELVALGLVSMNQHTSLAEADRIDLILALLERSLRGEYGNAVTQLLMNTPNALAQLSKEQLKTLLSALSGEPFTTMLLWLKRTMGSGLPLTDSSVVDPGWLNIARVEALVGDQTILAGLSNEEILLLASKHGAALAGAYGRLTEQQAQLLQQQAASDPALKAQLDAVAPAQVEQQAAPQEEPVRVPAAAAVRA